MGVKLFTIQKYLDISEAAFEKRNNFKNKTKVAYIINRISINWNLA